MGRRELWCFSISFAVFGRREGDTDVGRRVPKRNDERSKTDVPRPPLGDGTPHRPFALSSDIITIYRRRRGTVIFSNTQELCVRDT